MEHDEFSRQLEEVRNQVFHAIACYKVFIALWHTPEAVDVLNRHRSFFVPVRSALYHAMMMGFARVIDGHKKTMSLTNLLRAAKNQPSTLVPHIAAADLDEIENSLLQHRHTLQTLKRLRDQKLAHTDAKPEARPPLPKGDIDRLVETLGDVFNSLSAAHDQSVSSWYYAEERSAEQATDILRILREEMKQREAELEQILRDTRA